jgi:hypothetical protein
MYMRSGGGSDVMRAMHMECDVMRVKYGEYVTREGVVVTE